MITLKPLINKIVIKELSLTPLNSITYTSLYFFFTKVGVLQENDISALHIGRYRKIKIKIVSNTATRRC